ncbi:MAG: hypothetical protein PHD32_11525 [Eubacteriales bacterium]|nr:hypothetical protein [Eubacteriales bacterium]
MQVTQLIEKKKHAQTLTQAEIEWLVRAYTDGEIADYQMSAFLMAVWFSGMTAQETAQLTWAMARSGEMVDLSSIAGVKVDKHSTGGVADTTTLVFSSMS